MTIQEAKDAKEYWEKSKAEVKHYIKIGVINGKEIEQLPNYDIAIEALEKQIPKKLTLEELKKMDEKPVFIRYGDGMTGWCIVQMEGDYMYLCGPDYKIDNEPETDFYGLTWENPHNDPEYQPDYHFGLHGLGWEAWTSEPERENA